jgi:hypothetical protein
MASYVTACENGSAAIVYIIFGIVTDWVSSHEVRNSALLFGVSLFFRNGESSGSPIEDGGKRTLALSAVCVVCN